ncbi:hypothetical protein [Zobellia alginiliquefaciens]|uniref:hypothetical protein n=1 Tax=Zobellia alginiliquefaciens TaxID=3032586 RepID=UPI0023E44DE8|nr:hypothetical protein [Zobellia alginiliquefaciens]
MKTRSNFPLTLTQRQEVAILNNLQIDSQRLLAATNGFLQKLNFKTKEEINSVGFIYPVGFTTHSGQNELEGMRTLRQGTIELIKLPNDKIEIKSSTNLKHLAIVASGIGLIFCLVGFYISEVDRTIEHIALSLILTVSILVIGKNYIKNKIISILNEIVQSAAKSI